MSLGIGSCVVVLSSVYPRSVHMIYLGGNMCNIVPLCPVLLWLWSKLFVEISWCCRESNMLIISSHALVVIPSRWAARDANVIMMRSKHDLASLSKEMSSVLVSRLIENIVCLKRDTSDVSQMQ